VPLAAEEGFTGVLACKGGARAQGAGPPDRAPDRALARAGAPQAVRAAGAGVATLAARVAPDPFNPPPLPLPAPGDWLGDGPGEGSPWWGHTWEELDELDREGRVVVTDHGCFVLFNVYGPSVSAAPKGGAAFKTPEELEERAAERQAFKLRFYEVRRGAGRKVGARRGAHWCTHSGCECAPAIALAPSPRGLRLRLTLLPPLPPPPPPPRCR
jgi:hypothetical protein